MTENGIKALYIINENNIMTPFCANDLTQYNNGQKIHAQTLNSVAKEGFLEKLGGSPVMYQVVDGFKELYFAFKQGDEKGQDNSNLVAARKNKNDEFYTLYNDIEEECSKFRKYFKGKTIYLPCDDPANKKSEFWSYFVDNFDAFGLKKLIATHYEEDGSPAYKIWIEDDTNGDGFIDDGDALQEDLKGDGDFRSEECTKILEESDIVITNPPFSLFREFVSWILKADKKFLIIGNQNAITYKEFFPLIKDNKVWPGYTFNKTKEFIMSDDYELKGKAFIDENNKKHGFVAAICWFTNLPTNKRTEELILTKKYDPALYPKYDDYDAIEVNRVVNIPMDYDGIMGVPITFIDKYNPKQFEIIWLDGTDTSKWYGRGPSLEGKIKYRRIFIQRKK